MRGRNRRLMAPKYFTLLKIMLLLFCILLLPLCSGVTAPGYPREALLRLHVRANSDAPEDQALKNQVRDNVLKVLGQNLSQAGSAEDARQHIGDVMPEIIRAAENAVYTAGYDYPVKVSLGEAAFPTRIYGEKVYRAGSYQALQVELGLGRGQNWWCVIFPPLCFVEVADGRGTAVPVNQNHQLRPRSRLLNWWRRLTGQKV